MYNQIIMGRPKKCINRGCKGRFFKESFLGYMPESEGEVSCIMRCPVCKDTFKVIQVLSIVKNYIDTLPSRPKTNKLNQSLITEDEIVEMRETLENANILNTLNE